MDKNISSKTGYLILGLVTVAALVVVYNAVYSPQSVTIKSTPNGNTVVEGNQLQPLPPPTVPKNKIEISNTSDFDRGYSLRGVLGEITNNDSATRSVILQVTFYDASGGIIGTGSAAVNEIAAGDTRTFEAFTIDDVSGYSTFKVQVDTLF